MRRALGKMLMWFIRAARPVPFRTFPVQSTNLDFVLFNFSFAGEPTQPVSMLPTESGQICA